MSTKENNDVAVEKLENEKNAADAKCELKGTKRSAEVSVCFYFYYIQVRHFYFYI